MRIFVWLMKVPGLAWFFFRVLLPLWNGLWSNLEAVFHLGERGTFVNALNALRFNVHSGADLAKWYMDSGFTWEQDPLSGLLDFSSKSWVSIKRNRGDCDDMMLISEYVLRGKYDECRRCYVYASGGKSHAICLLKSTNVWFAMSNQILLGPFMTMELAVRSYYQGKTSWYYVI